MNHSKEINYDKYNNETYSHNELLKSQMLRLIKLAIVKQVIKSSKLQKGSGDDKVSYYIIDYDHKNLKKAKAILFMVKKI